MPESWTINTQRLGTVLPAPKNAHQHAIAATPFQRRRIILHPDAHQQHHEKFNCNFCILNGWANPLMNRVARLLTHFGVLAEEPPTARNRRERAERKDAKLKERS